MIVGRLAVRIAYVGKRVAIAPVTVSPTWPRDPIPYPIVLDKDKATGINIIILGIVDGTKSPNPRPLKASNKAALMYESPVF